MEYYLVGEVDSHDESKDSWPEEEMKGRELSQSIVDKPENDSLQLYLKEIMEIPLLSPEEEIKLSIQSKRHSEKGKEAKRRLIEANQRLVYSISKKYLNWGISLSDLIQTGNIGLTKAVDHFDPAKGHRFSTFAFSWIRFEILHKINDNKSEFGVHIPRNKQRKIFQYNKMNESLCQKLGRYPTEDEIAQSLEWSVEEVQKICKIASDFYTPPKSLEEIDSREEPLVPHSTNKLEIDEPNIWEMIHCLTKKQQDALRLKYKGEEEMTDEWVGEQLGICRTAANRLLTRAKEQLLEKIKCRERKKK
jgi:RNA polymerase sigma factor (sigma-70 family)